MCVHVQSDVQCSQHLARCAGPSTDTAALETSSAPVHPPALLSAICSPARCALQVQVTVQHPQNRASHKLSHQAQHAHLHQPATPSCQNNRSRWAAVSHTKQISTVTSLSSVPAAQCPVPPASAARAQGPLLALLPHVTPAGPPPVTARRSRTGEPTWVGPCGLATCAAADRPRSAPLHLYASSSTATTHISAVETMLEEHPVHNSR
jgi:hypothetical protein